MIGSTVTGLNQYDNVFDYSDTVSRVVGAHTFKVGGELKYNEVNANADVQSNGLFAFFRTETGRIRGVLIGAPSRYEQGDAQPFYIRNGYGIFPQNSWRVRPNLTFNYGARWDVEMPFHEKFDQIQTLVAGEQSVVYPARRLDWYFPEIGDITFAGADALNDFSPRLGVAYRRAAQRLAGRIARECGRFQHTRGGGSLLHRRGRDLLGSDGGRCSVRKHLCEPGASGVLESLRGLGDGLQRRTAVPAEVSRVRSVAEPSEYDGGLGAIPADLGAAGIRSEGTRGAPMQSQYNLSLQRQLGNATVLSVNYIGSQGHHQLVLVQANPGNPALCLSVSQQSQVAPGSATCGPFGETGTFTTATGQTVNVRGPFGPNFGAVDLERSVGNSNYNSLEVSVRHVSGRAQMLAGYTYGKSLDISSSIADELVPGNDHRTYGLSAFDIEHNFVASYLYHLPIDALLHANNRLTEGWVASGIVHFSTGLPVTMQNSADTSLLGTQPNGVNPFGVDLPRHSRDR